MRQNTAFVTLTNDGYVAYTLNCLGSLNRIGVEGLHCYAIGRRAHKLLQKKGFRSSLIDNERLTRFEVFRRGNWADITFNKFSIIHDNLKRYDYVLFTDGDIVFKNDAFIDYCYQAIGGNDLLIQNDSLTEGSIANLCSGFMFIRSNEATLGFFDPIVVKKKSDFTQRWDDQLYINKNKSQTKLEVFPLELFPNGRFFYKFHQRLNPYIIHFNWCAGHTKAKKILKHKQYFSAQDFYRLTKLSASLTLQTTLKRLKRDHFSTIVE